MEKKRTRKRRAFLPGVDLHDKSQHRWYDPRPTVSNLWVASYHIPSEYTGSTTILQVFGETKKQCQKRKARIIKALKLVLIEEVSQ